ncbi:MAG: hypothetical protein AAFQ07_05160 [Chloroflexota bacterium]
MQLKKKKGQGFDAIQFVSQWSLDEVASAISHVDDPHITSELQPVDADTIKFELVYKRKGRTTAKAIGEFQQWAHNMTFVRANTVADFAGYFPDRRLIVFCLLLASPFLLMILLSGGDMAGFWIMFYCFSLGISAGIHQILFGHGKNRQSDAEISANDQARLLDTLANIIHDKSDIPEVTMRRLINEASERKRKNPPAPGKQSTQKR